MGCIVTGPPSPRAHVIGPEFGDGASEEFCSGAFDALALKASM